MVGHEEKADGTFVLYTHCDEVCTALSKLGYSPDDSYTHEGIVLFKYTLPNRDVLKNPVVAKSVMESALDLKHIIRRLELPLYTVGDDVGVFQCCGLDGDAYLGLARDPALLNELLQKSADSGIRSNTITIDSWEKLHDTLSAFQTNDIKFVTRFLDTKMVEKYSLSTVLVAIGLMLDKPSPGTNP
jgi:hypothetical protein